MDKNKLYIELQQQLAHLDLDQMKLDAVMQLKRWQRKMLSVIDQIYSTRLNDIDTILLNLSDDIRNKQQQLAHLDGNDTATLLKLQHEIDELKSYIVIEQAVPDQFQQLIEETIRIKHDDEDDDMVIVDIDTMEIPRSSHSETRISKIFHSEPIQQALAVSLTNTLTHLGTLAVTSTSTMAATTIAKTALASTACGLGTVAYGMGRIAMGTTKKVWSLVVSTDN